MISNMSGLTTLELMVLARSIDELEIKGSNLCNEIYLETNALASALCCLSFVNAECERSIGVGAMVFHDLESKEARTINKLTLGFQNCKI